MAVVARWSGSLMGSRMHNVLHQRWCRAFRGRFRRFSSSSRAEKRMYPDKPLLAVSAFVVRESEDAGTEVLLVKRSKEPAAGAWALPGGNVEVGESLVEAAKREVKEECEIEIRDVQEAEGNSAVKRMALPSKPTPFLAVDGIDKDDKGDVRWHYVIVQVAGEPVDPRQNANPKDDAADAHWMALDKVRRGEVENLVPGVMNVAEAAMRSFRPPPPTEGG